MKKLFYSLSLLFTSFTYANSSYECFFTEPFITINIIASSNSTERTGDTVEFSRNTNLNTSSVKESSELSGVLSLTFDGDEKSNYVLEINKLIKGSDGMSDKVYSFDAVLKKSNSQFKLIGGCDYLTIM